jgi:hypothetical protein
MPPRSSKPIGKRGDIVLVDSDGEDGQMGSERSYSAASGPWVWNPRKDRSYLMAAKKYISRDRAVKDLRDNTKYWRKLLRGCDRLLMESRDYTLDILKSYVSDKDAYWSAVGAEILKITKYRAEYRLDITSFSDGEIDFEWSQEDTDLYGPIFIVYAMAKGIKAEWFKISKAGWVPAEDRPQTIQELKDEKKLIFVRRFCRELHKRVTTDIEDLQARMEKEIRKIKESIQPQLDAIARYCPEAQVNQGVKAFLDAGEDPKGEAPQGAQAQDISSEKFDFDIVASDNEASSDGDEAKSDKESTGEHSD